jgi:hypothetical protein
MSVEHAETSPPEHQLYIERDGIYWETITGILQETDTGNLKAALLAKAEALPDVNQEAAQRMIALLEQQFEGKIRRFTGEQEINHAYRVALLLATTVNPKRLTHDAFMIALGHDLYEDTSLTSGEIEEETNIGVATGIVELSHHHMAENLYPGFDDPSKVDRQKYLSHIIAANTQHPHLLLTIVKACDQLAVANDPFTPVTPGSSDRNALQKMRTKKLGEMDIFEALIPEYHGKTSKLISDFENFTETQPKTDS